MQSVIRIFLVIGIIVGGAIGAMMYRKADEGVPIDQSNEKQSKVLPINQAPTTAPPVRVNGPIKELDKNDRA